MSIPDDNICEICGEKICYIEYGTHKHLVQNKKGNFEHCKAKKKD
jgi:hypothetical protein